MRCAAASPWSAANLQRRAASRSSFGQPNWKAQGQDIAEFKYFKRWFDELSARPAVQRGLAVTAGPTEDPESLPPEERERRMKLLYNQRARPAPAEGGLTAT